MQEIRLEETTVLSNVIVSMIFRLSQEEQSDCLDWMKLEVDADNPLLKETLVFESPNWLKYRNICRLFKLYHHQWIKSGSKLGGLTLIDTIREHMVVKSSAAK